MTPARARGRPGEDAAQRRLIRFGLPQGAKLSAVTSGHINESWCVEVEGRPVALLQWLNDGVFEDAAAVQANVETVLAHLAASDTPVPELLPADDGRNCVIAPDGLWRAFRWLPARATRPRPLDAREARAAGDALGTVLGRLRTLAHDALRPVLEGFHDPGARMAALRAARDAAPPERLASAASLLDHVDRWHARRLGQGHAEGGVQVLHGDPKFTNFLVDARGASAPVLVDWDTAMVGPLAWDFGDFLRSAANAGGEDDPTTARVDTELLHAGAAGCIAALVAQREEADGSADRRLPAAALAEAPAHMAFLLAVRFLTDHLEQDRYFRITRPEQNLERAAAQAALAEQFAAAAPGLADVIVQAAGMR